jgi:hypothetical protein
MAQIRLSIATVNITNDLIVIARKTTTPLVIEAQEVYDAPHPTTQNVVLPAAGDIDPVIYYVDFYESGDGVSLDLLLSSFQYDLKNNVILSERRFYTVGGLGPNDPPADQDTLTDPYLDGKTISGVFKEGFRYLKPETEAVPEWEVVAGGGIKLLGGKQFSFGEVVSVEISYTGSSGSGSSGGGLYNGTVLIDTNTTLNTTYRNKRIRTESAASNVLVVTLEPVGSVPDGAFYHFTNNGGNQNQTRVLPSGSETIKYNGENYPEMWVGKGEYLRITKTGTFWEGELVHPFTLQVGEHASATWKDHPSCKPEDGGLYDGDEWPRIWWWLKNKLAPGSFYVDDTVIDPGYTHPVDFAGLFVLHSTLKKFRMPNTQGWSERGLANFNTYSGDAANRPHDYPGGTQAGMVGAISFALNKGDGYLGSGQNPGWFGPGNPLQPHPDEEITLNNGYENRVKNFGVVYLRRF